MPIVHVNSGKVLEKAKTVIQNKTKAFVDLGIPEDAVEVIVHEIPRKWRNTCFRKFKEISSKYINEYWLPSVPVVPALLWKK